MVFFERSLLDSKSKTIEETETEDILYFSRVFAEERSFPKKLLRSIALYFCFLSKPSLAARASELREKEVSSDRKGLKLDSFLGHDRQVIDKLVQAGIIRTDQMIEAAFTPELRESLSQRTGIEIHKIIEYLKLSDLSRLKGMKGVRARLYYEAGVDVDKLDNLSSWESEQLRLMLIDFVEKTGFEGIPPLPKEVSSTIEAVRAIGRLVLY
ncbi:DUF4332 domain-containing protein [Mesotoga sp. B105.6.4]|uniref:DUF4332 domain-containing protein n=1 Tax=Mesotoga sp. B105.6.4 TaxID=1582224 RepID=UPI0015E11735|nr:DUF4332 domain-containing protein [Mesotoga sp. B105.6.4]